MTAPRLFAPTRRALLAGLALAPLVACTTPGEAPLGLARVRAVRIDAAPLAAKGVSNWAARLRAAAEAAVPTSFAGALAPADRTATDLTLSITAAWLYPYVGSPGDDGDDAFFDWIEATLTVSGGGRATTTRRLFVRQPPTASGPWYRPGIDDIRTERLARALVAEARRLLAP